jgi:hypothetical protein
VLSEKRISSELLPTPEKNQRRKRKLKSKSKLWVERRGGFVHCHRWEMKVSCHSEHNIEQHDDETKKPA